MSLTQPINPAAYSAPRTDSRLISGISPGEDKNEFFTDRITYPLLPDQREAYELYTSANLFCRLTRSLHFAEGNDWALVELKDDNMKCAGVGALVGAVFGFFITYRGEPEPQPSWENKIPRPAITIGGCALAGAFVGSLFATTRTFLKIEKSHEYSTWRDKAIRDKIYPLFQQYLESDLPEFLCPITHDLIGVPVKDPKGRAYEREAIQRWIRGVVPYTEAQLARIPSQADQDRVRFRTSPFSDMELNLQDLVYDVDYHSKLAIILKKLFDTKINKQIKEGLITYATCMIKDRHSLVKAIINEFSSAHVAGKLSEEQLLQAIRECKKHYGLSLTEVAKS